MSDTIIREIPGTPSPTEPIVPMPGDADSFVREVPAGTPPPLGAPPRPGPQLSTLDQWRPPESGWSLGVSPESDKTQSVYDTAIALSEGLGVPVWQAFSQAQALVESPVEQHRDWATAIRDKTTAERLGVRITELANLAMDVDDPDIRSVYMKQIAAMQAALPNTQYLEKAGFVERVVVGTIGIAEQMRESMLGGESQRQAQDAVFGKNLSIWQRLGKLFKAANFLAAAGRGEAGGAYLDQVQNNIPHEIAKPLAKAVGNLNNLIEIVGESAFMALMGPFGSVAKRALPQIIKRLGWDGPLVQLGLRMAAKVAGGFTVQMGQELTQETVTWLAGEMAKDTLEFQKNGGQPASAWKGFQIDEASAAFKDVAARWGAVLTEAGPGMLGLSFIPGVVAGVRGIPGAAAEVKAAETKTTGAAKPAEPTPAHDLRAAIEAAPTPGARGEASKVAETAKVAEIATAAPETLGAVVRDAVEFVETREAAEAEVNRETPTPVEAAPVSPEAAPATTEGTVTAPEAAGGAGAGPTVAP